MEKIIMENKVSFIFLKPRYKRVDILCFSLSVREQNVLVITGISLYPSSL